MKRARGTTHPMSPKLPAPLVVVGNGMVGARLCQLLRSDPSADPLPVVVFGEEPLPAYDRIKLSKLIDSPHATDLTLLSEDWYRHQGIALHTGDPVVAIDPAARVVRAASGKATTYGTLVLATGSEAARPPIPGAEHLMVLRSAEDAERLHSALHGVERVAVIGGGLLGLEAAAGIRARGVAVCVFDSAAHLMARQLDEQGAAVLARRLEREGIEIRTSRHLDRVSRDRGAYQLHFRGTKPARADLVVCAIGVRPRDQLARQAGLEVSERGGVLVGDDLSTSCPEIYAIGDCARHRGQVYGLVAPGYQMARVVAETLRGRAVAFEGAKPWCRLTVSGTRVAAIGDLDAGGAVIRWTADDRYRALLTDAREGKVVGARGVGEWPQLAALERAIDRGLALAPEALQRFAETGELPALSATTCSRRDDATVCFCVGVTIGQLKAAIDQGARDVEALKRQTQASTVCGSCEPQLAALCEGQQPPARRGRGLVALSAAALLGCALILLIGPLPFADSVQAAGPIAWMSELWRDGVAKQATGFALLGTALISLVLSARKRLRWLRRGRVETYRLVHAAAGLTCVGLVVAHTGMHLGDNLNGWLMGVFLATLATGALLGISSRGRLAKALSRLKPALMRSHVVTLWALSILIGFHVFAVYYY